MEKAYIFLGFLKNTFRVNLAANADSFLNLFDSCGNPVDRFISTGMWSNNKTGLENLKKKNTKLFMWNDDWLIIFITLI